MKTCCNGFWIIKTKQCNLRKAKREDGLERIWRRKNNPNWVLTDTFFVIDDTGRVVGIADFRHDSSVLRGKFCGAGDCREGRVGGIKQEAVNNDGIIKPPLCSSQEQRGVSSFTDTVYKTAIKASLISAKLSSTNPKSFSL